jgi:spermidine synthase
VAFGTAEIRPDPARPAGWTVLVDGVDQSYVDLADPRYLAYPYIRRLAGVIDAAAPGGVPLRVLHLGGGGLTLPRYVAATRPGSVQVVVERDPALIALVGSVLPLPGAGAVEVRAGDAREAVRTGDPVGYDVVVADVFDGARMPDSVAETGFATGVARLLRPGGLLGMNLTDLPPLAYSRIQAATLRAAFGDVALVAGAAMLRGRRAGNTVLVAAGHAGALPVRRLAAAAARDAEPGRVLHGAALDAFVAGARPRPDTPG